jgi:hypothetical protein
VRVIDCDEHAPSLRTALLNEDREEVALIDGRYLPRCKPRTLQQRRQQAGRRMLWASAGQHRESGLHRMSYMAQQRGLAAGFRAHEQVRPLRPQEPAQGGLLGPPEPNPIRRWSRKHLRG